VATSVFQVAREISRRELERHHQRIIGITASAPTFKDQNGQLEWVCDVRIGRREEQGLIRDVLVSQWALGVVNDMNVPVLLENSESGRLTIIARSEVRLPDVSLRTFSHAQLGYLFMTGLLEDDDGDWRDGFGHLMSDPNDVVGTSTTWTWVAELTPIDDIDLEDEDEPLDQARAAWEAS
jgi:hypothetical protein